MNWPTVAVSEIAATQYGYTASATEEPVGPKFLRITDIVPSSINWSSVPYCRIDERNHARYLLRSGDVVVARTGATTGYAKLIRSDQEAVFASYLVRFRVHDDRVDERFLGLVMESASYKAFIKGTMGGAAQPNANANILARFISAYDDLIENNRRRIALLEKAARLIYREWFVHFRFPGHEHVRVIDGLPEGWERKSLGQLTSKIGSGATPRGGESSYQTAGTSLFRSQNIYDYRFDSAGLAFIDEQQAKALANVEVQLGDILLNITGASVGRCCAAPSRFLPARVNQHVMIVRADKAKISAQFLLHSINTPERKQALLNIARAGGATREALTKEVVSDFTIIFPPNLLLENFDGTVGPISSQQELLAATNEKLADARDLLLPRLMNGEIAV
jgi:type I restriction enzyme, S subunit